MQFIPSGFIKVMVDLINKNVYLKISYFKSKLSVVDPSV